MACTTHPASDAAGRSRATPRAMTRCECAGVSFEDIARRLKLEGHSLEELCRRTGCAGTCTACLPDLQTYVQTR